MQNEDLIELTYEAAFLPELWPDVCDRIAGYGDAYSTSLITLDHNNSYRWVSSTKIQEQMALFADSPLRAQNVRPFRHLEKAPFSYLRDIDVMTEEEIANDPVYGEFMRPWGLGWTLGDVLQEPTGHLLVVDLIRKESEGPFGTEHIQRMNEMKSHLTRASWMASRLAFKEAASMVQALELLALPAAVISDAGAVVAANDALQRLSPDITIGRGNRMAVASQRANELLTVAIAAVAQGREAAVQSIPLLLSEEPPPSILHIVPIRRSARDIFSRSSAIVIVTRLAAGAVWSTGVLTGLFDLTTSEAVVAREMARGATIDEAAIRLKLSPQTVRTYLKRVYSKTGTSRQAELVALLATPTVTAG